MLKRLTVLGPLLATLTFCFGNKKAEAQVISTEERFQDLFISAGYGTLYGAALGAALLSFQTEPANNLKLVALGASVGFITGSLLGSYIIISPVISESQHFDCCIQQPLFASSIDVKHLGIEGQVTLLKF